VRPLRATLAIAGIAIGATAGAGDAAAQTARLSLQSVFGQGATALVIPFGTIDVDCIGPPPGGVSCLQAPGGASATWYGNVRFAVRLTGLGRRRARLLGVRQAGGTVPSGALLDGPAGVAPTRSYPILPSNPIVLASSLGNGNTMVTRAIGMRVTPADASGPWTTSLAFSLVME
jgi:hypothetical protein